MIQDILEQSTVIKELCAKYFEGENGISNLDFGLKQEEINFSKIYITASGSSRNVGGIARYFTEKLLDIPVFVEYASEFAHKKPALKENDLVIAISQSGETADTYSALKYASDRGCYTLALTNNNDSKIHNLSRFKMEVGAGKETSVAATKSFTAQLFNLYVLALYLAKVKGVLSDENLAKYRRELIEIPSKLEELFEKMDDLKSVAEKMKDSKSIVIIGRGLNSGSAREGALKIKETCYIDANGYPSGEFLHGYLALLDASIPLISITAKDANNLENYNLSVKNTEELMRKRCPPLILLKSFSDKEIEDRALFKDASFINIPDCSEEISAFYSVVIFQIISFKMASLLGYDVNSPRGLCKSVTQE